MAISRSLNPTGSGNQAIDQQSPFQPQAIPEAQWRVQLSNDWDVLGPFPIHAREQYLLSPAFPLEVSPCYVHDSKRTWPSSHASSGEVGWSKAYADASGNLAVSFPEVDWDALRSTEGWAALQYHSVLHTKLTIYPPGWKSELEEQCIHFKGQTLDEPEDVPFRLLVTLLRGSQFTVLPSQRHSGGRSQDNFIPVWHSGNIYGMNRAPPSAVDLPSVPNECHPTTYDFFVSGDYEIRLFGDPKDANDSSPTLRLSLNVSLEAKDNNVVRELSHDMVPDFVGGYAFGDTIAVGLRSIDSWWTVQSVSPGKEFPSDFTLSLHSDAVGNHTRRYDFRLAPTQTRMLSLMLKQRAPCYASTITFFIHLVESKPSKDIQENSRKFNMEVTLNISHLKHWNFDSDDVIRATFLFKKSNPTSFLVKPPFQTDGDMGKSPPLLALHGAGVDIFASTLWADTLPRQKLSWIVIPTGRTEWGLDWHGPSAAEAWACISALRIILSEHNIFHAWRFAENTKVILLGHSNGGQGVWYMASRYPDRVLAAIPAAGYIKSQAYVPLTQSRSAHYMDPSLRAVLESSLTPDDNDLFLSNLIDIPILAIHGGADTNVPTWHSRQYIASMKEWGARDAILHIDEGKPHFYLEVFRSADVVDFLQNATSRNRDRTSSSSSFTLTVVNPAHSGSMRGWTIDSIKVPGRIARLHVSLIGEVTFVRTENVKAFTISEGALGSGINVQIDHSYGPSLFEPRKHCGSKTFTYKMASNEWETTIPSVTDEEENTKNECNQGVDKTQTIGNLHGRVQDILDSPDTHAIIIPDSSSALPTAQRIAHVLNVYHKLDAQIYSSDEAMALWGCSPTSLPLGNIIALGRSQFTDKLLDQSYTPFSAQKQGLKYAASDEHTYGDPGTGFILLHPHPGNAGARALVVLGTDEEGFERAVRAFPYRTGVPIPDFLIFGSSADHRGAAGVLGAGVFGDLWEHNDPMTWQT